MMELLFGVVLAGLALAYSLNQKSSQCQHRHIQRRAAGAQITLRRPLWSVNRWKQVGLFR